MMEIEEIKKAISEITEEAEENCDNAMAHIKEDKLFHRFVTEIADGHYKNIEEVIQKAKEVVTVLEIDYIKWYD